jgi:hypothetical protein
MKKVRVKMRIDDPNDDSDKYWAGRNKKYSYTVTLSVCLTLFVFKKKFFLEQFLWKKVKSETSLH